jgi:beta-N-acetylhexosaminidase
VSLACVFGLAGPTLTAEEAAFFRDVRPWGFILFRRNVVEPRQVRGLVENLRACVSRAEAPVMIDQEGGRVQRLGPPAWPSYPPARAYGLCRDARLGCDMARLGARLMAADLAELGLNVDCAPVADVPDVGAHDIIGDRAYARSPQAVGELASAAAEGLLAGGVLPVVKHIPGHGRARSDSHEALPVVDASLDELDQSDFMPFRRLRDMPMAMTAHVVFSAIDARNPATTSPLVIDAVIRRRIGFAGLLISDDLSMKALEGEFASRASQALDAGCDVVLHCNGDMSEMSAVAAGARELAGEAQARASAALARASGPIEPLDADAARARLDAFLGCGR